MLQLKEINLWRSLLLWKSDIVGGKMWGTCWNMKPCGSPNQESKVPNSLPSLQYTRDTYSLRSRGPNKASWHQRRAAICDLTIGSPSHLPPPKPFSVQRTVPSLIPCIWQLLPFLPLAPDYLSSWTTARDEFCSKRSCGCTKGTWEREQGRQEWKHWNRAVNGDAQAKGTWDTPSGEERSTTF